ncbi:hypothetical protein PC116_g15245 [Phytophthora cactorum]|nr:hypothetical protein PC116_g15245 [Phytophthora cactorum]
MGVGRGWRMQQLLFAPWSLVSGILGTGLCVRINLVGGVDDGLMMASVLECY